MRRLAVLAVDLAACTSTARLPSTTGVATTTASSATTVTTRPLAAVAVRLSDVESLAAKGARVQIGQTVQLGPGDSEILLLPFDQPVRLSINYVVGGAPAEPAWTQEVLAAEDGSTQLVIEQPWRAPAPVEEPIVLAWQAGGTPATYLDQLAAARGLTVTSPRWWTLDSEGFLVGETDADFIAAAHELGIEVWPYITNGFERARTHSALADAERRTLIATQLSTAAERSGADGVNVDFEAFGWADRDNFTAFVTELSGLVHSWGGIVSVDINARTRSFATPSEARADRYDRRALAEAVDYVALMAYDEYNRARPSGPTASQAWAEDALHWLLRYSDPQQILLGIPLYSRIWDPEDLTKPTTATIGTVVELSALNRRTFDPKFGIDRIDLEDGRYIWAEDYENLTARIALAREAGVAGTAAWRLGFDTPEVWQIVAP